LAISGGLQLLNHRFCFFCLPSWTERDFSSGRLTQLGRTLKGGTAQDQWIAVTQQPLLADGSSLPAASLRSGAHPRLWDRRLRRRRVAFLHRRAETGHRHFALGSLQRLALIAAIRR
jgi:hypothetical protein